MHSNIRVFITAGDPSGDVHAARVMEQLRLLVPNIVFEGFGGPAMEMQGLRSLAHINQLAVTGFWEVAKRYSYFSALLKRCANHIRSSKPAAFIPVDYPGFNLRLAKYATAAKVPTHWYIAPQLWAWGKNRGVSLAAHVKELYVVFPFEVEFFAQFGIEATFVGHPLCEGLANDSNKARVASPLHVPNIVLMPGSRKQELLHHVPLLVATVDEFRKLKPDAEFTVLKATNVQPDALEPLVQRGVRLSSEHLLNGSARYSAGLIKAGTSTLEATLAELPFATFYKTSGISYQLSKRLVNVDSVTMANLLLQQPLVHEYLQHRATPTLLAQEVLELLENEPRRTTLINGVKSIREMLGSQHASLNVAQHIVEKLRL